MKQTAKMSLKTLANQTEFSKNEIVGYRLFNHIVPARVSEHHFYKDAFSLIETMRKVEAQYDQYSSRISSHHQIQLQNAGVPSYQAKINRIQLVIARQNKIIDILSDLSSFHLFNSYDPITHGYSNAINDVINRIYSIQGELSTISIEENAYLGSLNSSLSSLAAKLCNLKDSVQIQENIMIAVKLVLDINKNSKVSHLQTKLQKQRKVKRDLEYRKEAVEQNIHYSTRS